MLVIVYMLLLTICKVRGEPTGCTYYPLDLKYECTARSWTLPLALADFDHVPQSLSLIDVNGALPSSTPTATVSGFDVINTTSFDANVVPTLTIRCYTGGMLIYQAGTFTGLSYFKEVHIQNCQVIAMPDLAFQDFGDLNYFGLEGGTIGDIGYDAFQGLNIYPMTVPFPQGTFTMTARLDSGVLPNGLLYSLTNVTNIVIDNANMDTLQADMFQTFTKLQYLSLRYNKFTSLPSSVLSNLQGLHALNLNGIAWECTCDNVWFLDYCQTNNISLHGSIICSTPSTYRDKKAYLYKKEQCPVNITDPCADSLPGISVGTTCLTYSDIAVFIGIVFSLSLVIATLLITIHTKRQHDEEETDESRPNPGKGGQRKLSASNMDNVSAVSTVEAEAVRARQEDDIVDEIL